MKKLLLASLLAASLTPFSANAAIECEDIASLAKTIMDARQSGISLPKLMGAVNNSQDEATKNLGKLIVMDAFESPGFRGAKYKKREINSFENKWMLSCMKKEMQRNSEQ